jgi:hypothetical protein
MYVNRLVTVDSNFMNDDISRAKKVNLVLLVDVNSLLH